MTSYDTEVECLAGLVAQARPGDVVGLMCHAQRQEVYAWIEQHGGTPDSPEDLGAKVRAATGAGPSQGETPPVPRPVHATLPW